MHTLHRLIQLTVSAIIMLAYYQFRKVHIPFFNQSQIIVIIYIMFFRASFQTEVLQYIEGYGYGWSQIYNDEYKCKEKGSGS